MQKKPYFKFISLILVFTICCFTLPSQGWAMFIPSPDAHSMRQTDMLTIQKTLESSLIKQRIMDYGLTSEEALARINGLTDEQIHQFAGKLDALQAGGDGVDALIFIVLVAILVVLILEVTGHKVIIR